MITKNEMIPKLIDVLPSFQKSWDELMQEWKDEPEELPLYPALGDLARHLVTQLECGEISKFADAFAVIEKWLIEGDSYVKEAATVGLLETLQNTNIHSSTIPEQFEAFLGPESLRFWRKVEDFWEKGIIITND